MKNIEIGIPKLRFPGFTGAWEQRKLGELFKPSRNKNNNGLYNQKDILAASLGTELIPKRIFFGLKSTKESVKNYRVVKNGDLIYTKSPIKGFPNGIVRTNKGNVGIVPSLYCVYQAQKEINTSIIQLYFEDKNRLNFYLFPLVNVGARNNVNITDLEFLDGIVKVPKSIEEQKKIVDFIEHFNKAITLHQRRLEHLKKMKIGLLQKMFPKNGEGVPEFRFPSFTDAWEQRKLSDLYKKNLERNKGQFGVDKTISIATMHFKTEGNGASEASLSTYKVLRRGDIAFEGHTSKKFAFGRFVLNDIGNGIMSPRFTTLRPTKNMPSEFWKQYIHYEPIMRYPIVHSTKLGTMMNELVVDEFLHQSVVVPIFGEQQKIGTFFKQLDNLITLHQRKLDHLQSMKKGLLRQMFV
ncbi:restriction endonuclease subunit S [Liquorilactobacillus cacaonum]|uniref:Type I restriction modification DNA specificity domain protein n=1 Tax=Liquorilactobacillus cacaonum DSM 21116 TaxID=1423729 RepID=A0A0R2CPG6_9LACO|nr:restriction endonuclease subunit S [Liquorilactobacillus cacaonum]KRM90156.1 type I restriction modification DNA specificity domain protein [Liquorilactobacillus cacaonum DSM 21116]